MRGIFVVFFDAGSFSIRKCIGESLGGLTADAYNTFLGVSYGANHILLRRFAITLLICCGYSSTALFLCDFCCAQIVLHLSLKICP